MARRYEGFYKVLRSANLGDPEFWNKRFLDIDLRLARSEGDGEKIDAAVETMISVALGRLNDTFTPVVNEAIERLASVGALFTATSDTETNIGVGNRTFVLAAANRDGFVVPEYVSIRPIGFSDRGMIAQVINYDRATGLLDVAIALVIGAGTYAQWDIRLTGTPDLDHTTRTDNPHETTAEQVGAYTKAQVDTAIGVESQARVAAVSSEVTARNSAISAAIAALKGGVSTAYDTLAKIASKFGDVDTAIAGKQAAHGNLSALASLTAAANKMPYFTAGNAAALADLSVFARTILDDASGAAMFATMGNSQTTSYIKLPSGLTFQWGYSSAGGGGNIFYPFTFPGGILCVQCTMQTARLDAAFVVNLGAVYTNYFTAYPVYSGNNTSGAAGEPFYWMAIGY